MPKRAAAFWAVWIRHLDGTRTLSRCFTRRANARRWARYVGGTLPCAYLGIDILREVPPSQQ
jgi:hypothetical protein